MRAEHPDAAVLRAAALIFARGSKRRSFCSKVIVRVLELRADALDRRVTELAGGELSCASSHVEMANDGVTVRFGFGVPQARDIPHK